MKIPKHLQRQSFFFVFSKGKNIILLYMKIEKPEILLSSSPFFLTWGQKNIFTVMNIVKSKENLWSTVLNFIDFRGKRVFLLC